MSIYEDVLANCGLVSERPSTQRISSASQGGWSSQPSSPKTRLNITNKNILSHCDT
jgi:hypothetical protein